MMVGAVPGYFCFAIRGSGKGRAKGSTGEKRARETSDSPTVDSVLGPRVAPSATPPASTPPPKRSVNPYLSRQTPETHESETHPRARCRPSRPHASTMRFYADKFPEVDELVMVQVKQIQEMGAYVKLVSPCPSSSSSLSAPASAEHALAAQSRTVGEEDTGGVQGSKLEGTDTDWTPLPFR